MRTLVAEILEAWRRADRLMTELEPGSPEHAAASLASERLRDLYQDLTAKGVARELTPEEARVLFEATTQT